MALKIPHCARCSGVCELKTLPSVSGEDGPLKVTLLGINDGAGFPHSG